MPGAAKSAGATAASFQQQPAAILSLSRALTARGRQWKCRGLSSFTRAAGEQNPLHCAALNVRTGGQPQAMLSLLNNACSDWVSSNTLGRRALAVMRSCMQLGSIQFPVGAVTDDNATGACLGVVSETDPNTPELQQVRYQISSFKDVHCSFSSLCLFLQGDVLRPSPDQTRLSSQQQLGSFSPVRVGLVQLQALPVGDRSDFMTRLSELRESSPDSADPGSAELASGTVEPLDRTALWRALLLRKPPASAEDPTSLFRVPNTAGPVGGASVEQEEGPNQRGLRSRRHAFVRGHHQQHGQLMRVGCVLGTCQVQNLSHRLYQLMGQTGREDSSPMNPRSPHSYG
ncbi:hypothetical protein NFI96_004648 [Prochilodus magdalenae]|nr:hypothetical protein NFI96_004648 [Prochilodus magdalenae]